MLSKFLVEGDRIELQAVEKSTFKKTDEKKIYYSQVYEILSEDTMEITMPVERAKLILLPVDGEYDLVVYGANGPYQCFARIIDRYKSDNVYLLLVELTSNLRKYQRREYFRFSCAMEMYVRNLEASEIEVIEKKQPCEFNPRLPLDKSVIVDISGGGLRFLARQKYEPDSLLYISYHLLKNRERKKYETVGKVLSVMNLENRPGTYEHRVQYVNMDSKTREEIIKYIFEEERKNLRKGRIE